jgi:hypothetical protein
VKETELTVRQGAQEVDMVINIGLYVRATLMLSLMMCGLSRSESTAAAQS